MAVTATTGPSTPSPAVVGRALDSTTESLGAHAAGGVSMIGVSGVETPGSRTAKHEVTSRLVEKRPTITMRLCGRRPIDYRSRGMGAGRKTLTI